MIWPLHCIYQGTDWPVQTSGWETTMAPTYLSTKEAARHITAKYGVPCSPNWLAKICSTGGSPPYYPIGRNIYYRPLELEEWFESRVGHQRTSTSDEPVSCEEDFDLDEPWRTDDPAFDEVTRLENQAFDLDAAINDAAEKHHSFQLLS